MLSRGFSIHSQKALCLFWLTTIFVTKTLCADITASWPPPVVYEPALPESDPAATFLSQGMRYSLTGDMDNAVRALRAAIKISPAAPEPAIQLSLAMCALGQDSAAEAEAQRAELAVRHLASSSPSSSTSPHAPLEEAEGGFPYMDILRDRLLQRGGGRGCCCLPLLFPSGTVVQEDVDERAETCRCGGRPAEV